ncbi:MAG: MotA/TolQ/ExbB proton channel family protein [Phycisphaerae bacterium]
MIARIVSVGLAYGNFGLPALRQAMQEQGVKEVTRLTHRINYMGFLGAVAPMLGLLGTVIGMISSFNVLGSSKGSARPDELAGGIAFALVTTCEGLVLAIPMMFFHNFFRDRVAKLGQESGTICERLMRHATMVMEIKTQGGPAVATAAAPAPAPAPVPQTAAAAPVEAEPRREPPRTAPPAEAPPSPVAQAPAAFSAPVPAVQAPRAPHVAPAPAVASAEARIAAAMSALEAAAKEPDASPAAAQVPPQA